MKNIYMILAAATAALTMASCQKEDFTKTADIQASGKVAYIDITVGGLDGNDADTKAIKTGWTEGDRINIWYNRNTQDTPDLVIVTDGSRWAIDETATVSGKTPSASGSLYALYEASNDYCGNYSEGYYNTSESIAGSHAYATPMGACAKAISYTFSNDTLVSDINSWTFLSNLQVVIKGLDPTQADKYGLKIIRGTSELSYSIGGYRRTYSGFTGNNRIGDYVLGTANKDGVAFYLQISASSILDPEFILFDRERNVQWHYLASGKQVATPNTKCTGVTFSKDKLSINKITYDGISYIISGAYAAVTKYNEFYTNSYSGDVTIPSSITFDDVTYTVNRLAQRAFKDSYVTSVTLPETITSFEAYAFTECHQLASLVIPKSVTNINSANGVFDGCKILNISVSPENKKFFVEDGILYYNTTTQNKYRVYWIQENLTGEITLKEGTQDMGSNTCGYINASKIVFPAGFVGSQWGLGHSGIGSDITYEYNDADYDTFYARYKNTTNFAYCFGSSNIGKITLSINSVDDEDWTKYKALKDSYGFKNIIDRRTAEVY